MPEEDALYFDTLYNGLRETRPDTLKYSETDCGQDTVYFQEPDPSLLAFPDNAAQSNIVPDDVMQANIVPDESLPINKTPSPASASEGLRRGFTDPNTTMGMYDFDIATLGWYNVDQYVEGYPGTIYVSVKVKLPENVPSDIHVYLFCADKKMLSVSNDKKEGFYIFNKIDGKVPLFEGDRAIVLAFGSKKDIMLYGAKEFFIKKEQTLSIALKEATQDDFISFIKNNKIDGIKIDIHKKEMEIKQKPCLTYPTATDTSGTVYP